VPGPGPARGDGSVRARGADPGESAWSMLEKGLLTREEFDLMKAKILDTPTT
jgi:hypothetical protein